MNIIKRTEIVQNYLRDNVALNLLSRNWKMILADKKTFVCSLNMDFNTKPTHYVFLFDEDDVVIKAGVGLLEGNTIKLEKLNLDWFNN